MKCVVKVNAPAGLIVCDMPALNRVHYGCVHEHVTAPGGLLVCEMHTGWLTGSLGGVEADCEPCRNDPDRPHACKLKVDVKPLARL